MDLKEYKEKLTLLKTQEYLEKDEFKRKDIAKQISTLGAAYKRTQLLNIDSENIDVIDNMLDTMEIPNINEDNLGGETE